MVLAKLLLCTVRVHNRNVHQQAWRCLLDYQLIEDDIKVGKSSLADVPGNVLWELIGLRTMSMSVTDGVPNQVGGLQQHVLALECSAQAAHSPSCRKAVIG